MKKSSSGSTKYDDDVCRQSIKTLYLYLYLFICYTITIITKKCEKKCRKQWRGGLKETIELMLIRPPQLQNFEDGIKITATDTK